MALKKRLIRAYAASRSYRTRLKRFYDDDDSQPPSESVNSFTNEFTFEFDGRPNEPLLEFSGEYTAEFA